MSESIQDLLLSARCANDLLRGRCSKAQETIEQLRRQLTDSEDDCRAAGRVAIHLNALLRIALLERDQARKELVEAREQVEHLRDCRVQELAKGER